MDVEDSSNGPAAADIYSKLFYHVRAVLRACRYLFDFFKWMLLTFPIILRTVLLAESR
jgi:hypothetical protein